MLVRIVKMSFKTECIEQFKSFFEGRKEQIRNFEGNTHLELWQDRMHPNIFFTYSHWVNAAALDNYRHSAFFADTWAQTKILFDEKPEAWSVNQMVVLP